jgi:tRNA(Arg) A34 adenosine deaminase TadA
MDSKMTIQRAPGDLNPEDLEHLEAVVTLAVEIAGQGASPFAARLVWDDGAEYIDAVNTVREDRDVTGHAETNLLRKTGHISQEHLASATLYASCEPCAMCAAAICWSPIGRVVYALSHEQLRTLRPGRGREPGLRGTDLFEMTPGAPMLIGPVPEARGERPFR